MNFLDLNIRRPEVDEAALAVMDAADQAGANDAQAISLALRRFAGVVKALTFMGIPHEAMCSIAKVVSSTAITQHGDPMNHSANPFAKMDEPTKH
jgi:hypothetical protein